LRGTTDAKQHFLTVYIEQLNAHVASKAVEPTRQRRRHGAVVLPNVNASAEPVDGACVVDVTICLKQKRRIGGKLFARGPRTGTCDDDARRVRHDDNIEAAARARRTELVVQRHEGIVASVTPTIVDTISAAKLGRTARRRQRVCRGHRLGVFRTNHGEMVRNPRPVGQISNAAPGLARSTRSFNNSLRFARSYSGTCAISARVRLVVPPGGSFADTRRIKLGPHVLTVGRSPTCAVCIDVAGVDDEHARISDTTFIAVGQDCAIGDVPMSAGARRLLTAGDEIQIGSVLVKVELDESDRDRLESSRLVTPSTLPSTRTPAPVSKHAHPGVVPRTNEPSEAPQSRVADNADANADAHADDENTFVVVVVEGANLGDELTLRDEGREYTVGRGATCDLVVDDREVSREHVVLQRRGSSVYVRDLRSTRGSWLGRSNVYPGATVEWLRPQMLRVGATVLSLDPVPSLRSTSIDDSTRAAPLLSDSAQSHSDEPRSCDSDATIATKFIVTGWEDNTSAMTRNEPAVAQVHDATEGARSVVALSEQQDSVATRSRPSVRRGWQLRAPTFSLSLRSWALVLVAATIATVAAIFGVFSLIE